MLVRWVKSLELNDRGLVEVLIGILPGETE
jgi:hypothetical protein